MALACLGAAGCAPGGLRVPTGAGTPLPDPEAVLRDATAQCAGLRTLTAEVGLSGRAAGERLRGRLVAGFAEPDAMRVEAVAPFGAPVFIIATRGGAATLLLPREAAALDGEPPGAVLEALTGVTLTPQDLRALLTGCLSDPEAADGTVTGTAFGGGWASLRFGDGSLLHLRRRDGRWTVRGGERAGWRVEYPAWTGAFPASVRLRTTDADLRLEVRQLEANVALDDAAFVIPIPPGTRRVTLADLRRSGTLREAR
ncbi:MAG: hypothetical protein AB7I25_08570 [Vicinamibacterales bacterium]